MNFKLLFILMSGFLIPLAFFNFASLGCPNFFFDVGISVIS